MIGYCRRTMVRYFALSMRRTIHSRRMGREEVMSIAMKKHIMNTCWIRLEMAHSLRLRLFQGIAAHRYAKYQLILTVESQWMTIVEVQVNKNTRFTHQIHSKSIMESLSHRKYNNNQVAMIMNQCVLKK